MRLALVGAIGVDDLGDIVLLQENITSLGNEIEYSIFTMDVSKTKLHLEKFLPNYKIDIIEVPSLDKVDEKDLNSRTIPRINENLYKKYNTIYSEYLKCDALYFIGGGYFNYYWGKKMEVYFELPIRIFSYLEKPIYINGVTIGPFEEETYQTKYGLFKNCHTICLRDHNLSIRNLKKLGYTTGNLILSTDDILIFDQATKKEDIPKEKYIILHQFHWIEEFAKNVDSYYKVIANFLDYLIDNNYIDSVYFIPFNYFRNGKKGGDYIYGEKILNKYIKNKQAYILFEPFSSYQELRKIISGAEFVLANRYHPIVFAHGEYKPAIGIYVNDLYKQKLQGVYEVSNMNPEKHTFYINSICLNDLIKWYEINILNRKYELKYKDLYKTYTLQKRKSINNFLEDVMGN